MGKRVGLAPIMGVSPDYKYFVLGMWTPMLFEEGKKLVGAATQTPVKDWAYDGYGTYGVLFEDGSVGSYAPDGRSNTFGDEDVIEAPVCLTTEQAKALLIELTEHTCNHYDCPSTLLQDVTGERCIGKDNCFDHAQRIQAAINRLVIKDV